MFGQPFYHYTFRKIVASFGSIFSNIFVVKRNKNGSEIERIKVPLAYGPAERYLVRTLEDPDLNRNYNIKLPRMSFQITSIEYDSQRKLNTLKKNTAPIDGSPGTVVRQYQGVPYKINIELSVLSKFIDDSNQIIEQILPWFTPAFSITINSIPGMDYKDDLAIVLTSTALQDNYEDDWLTRRDIVWTLTFEIKAMFYGPMVNKDIITRAVTDVFNATGVDINNQTELGSVARVLRSTVEPSPNSATYIDEFGYVETIETFDDAKRLDVVTGEDVTVMNKVGADSVVSSETVPKPKIE